MLWGLIRVMHGSVWASTDEPPNTGPFRQRRTWCHLASVRELKEKGLQEVPSLRAAPCPNPGRPGQHSSLHPNPPAEPAHHKEARRRSPEKETQPQIISSYDGSFTGMPGGREHPVAQLCLHPRKKRTGQVGGNLDCHLWILRGGGVEGLFPLILKA